MSQAGYTPIQLYYSTTAAAVPVNTNLANGELAINITDGKLYYKDNTGTVKLLAGATAGPAGGSNTQVQYNSSGVLAGSANMTFDGTTLTAAGFSGPHNGTVGATTPSTGAFTTIRSSTGASSAIFGGGSSSNEVVTITAQTGGLGIGLGIQNSSSNLSGISFPTNASATTAYTYITADGRSGASGFIKSYVNDAVVSTLTSTGLGIGTTSFTAKLTAKTAANTYTGGALALVSSTSTSTYLTNIGGALYVSNDGSTDHLVLSSAGNLGLGVTPSAWSGFSGKPLQLGFGSLFTDSPSTIGLVGNAYYNGGWKYYGTGLASIYQQATGAHFWYTAASGTAGNAVSFTQVFGINASGAFGLGSTPSYGTSGQVLTSGGSGAAPTWTTVSGGGSAATPTALGTVYGKQTTSGGTPFLTAYGYNAGVATTGVDNTAIGVSALLSNITGAENTAVGYRSLRVTTGSYNTAVGSYAMDANTTGINNTAMGAPINNNFASLMGNTTGSYNTAYGVGSLGKNTTASYNTAVGSQALLNNTTGTSNTAVGNESLAANTTGINITALGAFAAYTSGTSNAIVAVGYEAFYLANNGNTDSYAATAVGYRAGRNSTTARDNTFIGGLSGYTNTTGNFNTAVGSASLYYNTTASYITAIGYQAGINNTTGASGLFVGAQAGSANTTGNYNSFVGGQDGGGYGAGASNTTGASNTALGSGALSRNTTASNNTAVGFQALLLNVTGTSLTAVGYKALSSTTAGNNTAVGREALTSNTTGSYNAAVGDASLGTQTNGDGNSALGVYSGLNCTTGYSNVMVGYEAGRTVTTGYENTLIGKGAGYPAAANNITTGYRNTIVGQRAALSANSDFRSIVIGFEATGKGSQTAFIDPNGSVYQGNNTATWAVISDRRLKKNITDNNIGLEKITQIQVRNFEYRLPEEITEIPQNQAIEKTGVQLGVISQELQQILPDCVKTESTGVLRVSTDNLTWYMINAIKELKAEVDSLKSQLKGA